MVQHRLFAYWLPSQKTSESEMKVGDLVYIDYGPHSNVPRFMALITEVEVDPDGVQWNTVVHAIAVESGKKYRVNKIDIKAIK